MERQHTPTELIEMEMIDTEHTLLAVGRFGVLMVAIALIALVLLLYKLGTLVSPLTSGELKLVVACFALIAMVVLAGFQFQKIANYYDAIDTWRKQSLKDYKARHQK